MGEVKSLLDILELQRQSNKSWLKYIFSLIKPKKYILL